MPLEDYSGGQGQNMGELGAPWGRLSPCTLGMHVVEQLFRAAGGLLRLPGERRGRPR